MASESSVIDQRIDEHAEEKKVGEEIIFQPKEAAGEDEADNNKEEGLTGMTSTANVSEEKLEPDVVSVADVIKKEEQHEKVGEVKNSLQESEVSNSSEPAVETNEGNKQSQADDGAHETPGEVQEKSGDFVNTSTTQEPVVSESKTEDLKDTEIKPTSENERKPEEAPLVSTGGDISKDGNVEGETLETTNPEFSKDKVDIELIKSEDSKDEIQVLVPSKTPTVVVHDASETPEKNDLGSSNLTSIDVPVKDLEVEFGTPEEQKPTESTETKEPSSNVSTIDAGDEVVGSSYEANPSRVAEVVEKKDDGLEVETIQTSVKIQEDLEAKPELAQIQSDENVSQGVEVKKDDEIVDGGIETSTVRDDVPPLAKVSSEEEKASEPGVVVEEKEVKNSSEGNIDAVSKVAEVSLEGGNVLEGDNLVDKDKFVNGEAVERELIDTFTDPTVAVVSSDQAKAPTTTEIVKEALEVTFKELSIAPEASEIPSEGNKVSAGDEEKSESLKGGNATSVEAPKDIITTGAPLDQVIEEKKSESFLSETQASSEDELVDKDKDVTKEINLQSQPDGAHETARVVQCDFVETSASQHPVLSESKTENLKDIEIKPTSENERKPEEALVSTGVDISESGNDETETQETAYPESSKEKVDIELIKSEDSKDEIQVFIPAEIPTVVVLDASKTPEKNDVDSSNLTSIEVPVKDLEVESGSLEEQKSKESTETKEPSSNEGKIDAGGEIVGSSYEVKPSAVAEVVEKKVNGLKVEAIKTSVEIHEDLETKPELAQTQSDENVSEGVEVKKDDEIVEGGIETSTVSDDVPSLAKVSSEVEKVSEPGVVVEEEEIYLEGDNVDTVPKVAEVSLEGGNVLEGDKLVDKETIVNTKAVDRNLIDKFTDPAEAELSSDQVKAPATTEIVKEESDQEDLEATSKELSISPEASEIPSEGDKVSAGDEEKSESLKGRDATSMEAPKYISNAQASLDQVIEEKSESSISETQAPSEDKLVDKEKDVNEKAKEINLQSQPDGAYEIPSVVQSDFVETSTSPDPVFSEPKTEDLKDTEIKPTSENEGKPVEAPLVSAGVDISENGNVDAETHEATNPESSKQKVDIELIKSEDSKDEIQALVPTEISIVVVPDASKTPEKNDVDSSNLTSIEVPTKDLEVESGSPEEQKPKESTETKEPSSSEGTIDAGGEVVGSSYEAKPSGVTEVVDKKDDGLKVETIQTSVKIHQDLEAKPELAQTQSDENVSEGVEVKKNDEIVEGGIETSTVPDDVPSLAKASSEEEKASEPRIVVEEEEISLEGDNFDTIPKVAEVSLDSGNVLEGDKLVDKEKVVNTKAVERDLVDTFRDPAEAEVSSNQIKSPASIDKIKASAISEIVKEESDQEPLEVTSKELSIAPEASEIPSEGDRVSAGDEEKSESLKGGDAISVEAAKDITTTEASLDQLIEEKKSESSISETQAPSEDKLVDKEKDVNEEAKEINLQSQPDGAHETPNVVQSALVETSASPEPVFSESKTEDLRDIEIKSTSENERKPVEATLVSTGVHISENGNVEAETQEETNPESSEEKVNIELIKSEDSKDEIQVLIPAEIPTVVVPDASKAPEKDDFDSSNLTSIEVPVKDLEVESGSPEEQKPKDSTETKEPSSSEGTFDAGGEVVGSSYEAKPSGVAEVVEKKDVGLKVETIQNSVEIHEDLEAKPELAQTQSDENVSEGVEAKKHDEIVEGGIETSTVPDDVPALAKVSSEEEKDSEPVVVVEEDETSFQVGNIDTVAEVSLEGGNVLEGDKLVDKDKVLNSEAVERDLVDTFTDPTDAEVSSDQVKAPATTEIVKEESDKEVLEVTSKELNIVPEASEVPSEGDTFSAGDEEKSESLIVGDATSVEAPKEIVAINESLDHLVEEKKSESSISELAAPTKDKLVDKEENVNVEDEERDLTNTCTDPTAAEVSSEQVKGPEIVEESDTQALEETSKELNIASEASEVPSEGDKLSAGDEKSESLKGEAATPVEAPKDITIVEESLDQVIEEKSESSIRETKALSEDRLADKLKDVDVEAKERDLVDTSTDPTAPDVYSDKVKAPETVEIVKYESDKQALEVTSKEPNIAAEAIEVPSEGDNISAGDKEKSESLKVEPATSVEAPKYINATEESLDQVIEEKTSESFISETGTPAEDRLVDNEKDMYVETIQRELVDASIDPTAAEVSSEQVEASETAEIVKEESDKHALEVTSKELNITPEASEVSTEVDKVCAGDQEKSKSLKGEDAISVEAPKDITTAEEWFDQVIKEKKSESSLSEMETPAEDKLVDKGKDLVDTSTDPTAAEVSSDQVRASETAEIIKEESNKQALEVASKELNIASEASQVPSEGDEISAGDDEKRESLKGEDATSVEVPKYITIAEGLPDQVIKQKKNESSKSEMEALVEDKLVGKEKDVNVEDEKKVLVDTSADPFADEVSSEQVEAPETAEITKESENEALELTSKELNIVPEASEVPSEGGKVSAGEEKSESLKGEDAISIEAPKDSTSEESTDQLIEENKSESTKSEMEAPIEITRDFDTSKLFPEAVKEIIASEAVEEKQYETSNDLRVEEKKANDSEDKKEEVKVEGALQNATDKPEQEELGAIMAESEKSKNLDPIVSSDTGDAKLTKEVTKRESNIFSKVKRSIVKAKKAILRKSPGPKTRSSEAKDENT